MVIAEEGVGIIYPPPGGVKDGIHFIF